MLISELLFSVETTHLHLMPRSRMHGAISPLPQCIFMAWYLAKHRDNFHLFCMGVKLGLTLRKNTD